MQDKLTDRAIKAFKRRTAAYDVMDNVVPSFGLRILPSGEKSFILYRRFPGSSSPVRRSLGAYGELGLHEAREKAREWIALIKKGVDPAKEAKRLQEAAIEAERAKHANTFGSAFESYLTRKASKLKSGGTIEKEMSREFAGWMNKPLADISQRDVKDAIQKIVDRGAPTQAHTLFAMLRGFFNWVVDSGDYGLKESPCRGIKPTVLIGERGIRNRTLKDFEIAAYWRSADALGYPFGPFFKLLLLTACRRNEVSDARWTEVDMGAKLWIIPAERMKGGAAHAVPLTPDITAILGDLPHFSGGDYVFSTTGGLRPISGFSKAKARLDATMAADLEAQGERFAQFIVHDIRRTARTKFSALPVEDVVRELLVAHARPGLHKIYDLHAYQDEKAQALTLWHAKLKTIVQSKTANIIQLAASA
jgi:integrase